MRSAGFDPTDSSRLSSVSMDVDLAALWGGPNSLSDGLDLGTDDEDTHLSDDEIPDASMGVPMIEDEVEMRTQELTDSDEAERLLVHDSNSDGGDSSNSDGGGSSSSSEDTVTHRTYPVKAKAGPSKGGQFAFTFSTLAKRSPEADKESNKLRIIPARSTQARERMKLQLRVSLRLTCRLRPLTMVQVQAQKMEELEQRLKETVKDAHAREGEHRKEIELLHAQLQRTQVSHTPISRQLSNGGQVEKVDEIAAVEQRFARGVVTHPAVVVPQRRTRTLKTLKAYAAKVCTSS
jgi:hypothetical protein